MGGRIDFVGSLAEAGADSPWKFFSVRLLVDHSDARLRPGMSVRVSLLLDEARAVVVVPVDAVFSCAGRSCCYVRQSGEVWEQPVTLGIANETHAEVREGLAAGDEVLLEVPSSGVRRREAPSPSA
jgi:multidrug efflux pump subunit AcrA (membrane-fusion protein)